MKIFAEKLNEHLDKQLRSVYLLLGNEPLLLDESRSAIRQKTKQLGFEERHRFTADASLNWQDIHYCCQALSLFSNRQLIEIDIPDSGINATIAKELVSVSEAVHSDIVLVIVGGKLTKAQESSKWFKSLSAHAVLVSCLTPEMQRLPQFVQQRCRALNLKPDAEAVQMLAQWHEGNLLALAQSLEKLALVYPDGRLSLLRVEEALSRHNHFTAFHWIDALLAGKGNRAQRILRQLQAEDSEPIILIRMLQKELIQLIQMQQALVQQPIGMVFDQYRIWQSKRPWYAETLKRLSLPILNRLIHLLAQAEVLSKTQYEQSPWPLLQQLSVEFSIPNAKIPILT